MSPEDDAHSLTLNCFEYWITCCNLHPSHKVMRNMPNDGDDSSIARKYNTLDSPMLISRAVLC